MMLWNYPPKGVEAADYLVMGQLDAPLPERTTRYALERARTLAALRDSEERYVRAIRGGVDGLWDWDLLTDTLGFSPRWKAMLGYAEDEIGSSPGAWFTLVHPADLAPLRATLAAHVDGRTPYFEHAHRMRHKDGTYRWMLSRGLAVRAANGKATRLTGAQTDITMRKRAEEHLMHRLNPLPLDGGGLGWG